MPEHASLAPKPNALLLLEDGSEFVGYGIGVEGVVFGELCFNTAMSGYEEILTDPSYYGQIITFTTPHIGNVGCNNEDVESRTAFARGLVVREAITDPSSWRATTPFNDWLMERELTGISGVDTRALTTHMRTHGHPRVAIAYDKEGLSQIDRDAIIAEFTALPTMKGAEMTEYVRSDHISRWSEGIWHVEGGYDTHKDGAFHVVAIDYGAKSNILRLLTDRGCRVTVMPGNSTVEQILMQAPDGVFLSNGPGDPAATASFAVPVIQGVIECELPVFGICLGHQLLGLALGARTQKLHQGHRGANHPVKALDTGKVEITSQNHGFVVCSDGMPSNVEVTHISLFDGSIEGIRLRGKPVFSVQYHPESSPGPHDSVYLFDQFVEMMRVHRAGKQ
jgi:carbamoyl-phosphate synthase small subunit